MSRSSFSTPRRAAGLTLIELIVVMAVLVILAGLALPKLDVFKGKANKAQAASNIEAVTNFVTAFKVQHDVFPDVWDSLLDATSPGTPYAALSEKLFDPSTGAGKKLATVQLTADEVKSLHRVGIFTVVDHDPSVEFPNNSTKGAAPRSLQANDTVVTINASVEDGEEILESFYPDGLGVPDDKKVVVFGLGPRNQMIGDILQAAPFYPDVNQTTTYARYLVVFEVDSGGGRARLLGVLDSGGDHLAEEIEEFYEA